MTTDIHAVSAAYAAAAQTATEGGLTFSEIVSELPTDPAAIITILFFLGSLGSVGLVIWFGRPKRGRGGKPA